MKLKVLLIVLLLGELIFAQANFINNSKIYEFLDRQETMGRITVNSHQKPYSRQKILTLLDEVKKYSNSLNLVERKELNFWIAEYSNVKKPNDKTLFFKHNDNNAFRFFEYADNLFYITAYPDVGAAYSMFDNSGSDLFYYNGISTYGNIGKHISFDMDFNDFSHQMDGVEPNDYYNTRAADYPRDLSTDVYNYDRTLGALTFSWDWGYVSLKKDYNYWGNNYNGNIIFSDRAPSFPQLYLNVAPADWFEFNYFYGELNSSINDTTTMRETGYSRKHIQLVEKYIASHLITLNLIDNLKISLGESVVISDKFEPIYLIPVLFFRMADHYNSESDFNSGNAQIFSAISYRIPSIASKLNLSVFIDEVSVTNLFGSDTPSKIGHSIGISNYDLLIDNTTIELEYVKINPFVYEHSDPAQSFYNKNYPLGNWMRSNSEMLYLKLSYKPLYNLWTNLAASYVHRGDFEDSESIDESRARSFLHGSESYITRIEANVTYEYLNNVKLYANFVTSNSWGENNLRSVDDDKYIEFTAGFKIGF